MDENKLNNGLESEQPENEALETSPEELAENEAVEADAAAQAEISADAEEAEAETTEAADAEEDTYVSFEKEPEDEMQLNEDVPFESPKKKKKGKKALVAVLIVVVVLGLVAVLAASLADAAKKIDVNKIVVSVGDVDSNAGEFVNTYSMYSYYAQYYGMTTEQVKEYAITELITVNTYYAKAIAEGYTLTEEDKAEIEASVANVETGAESSSMTAEEYLAQNICKGYTLDMYKSYVEKQLIAQRYYNDSLSAIDEEYKSVPEKVQKQYEEDRTLYDVADALYWYIDATEEKAKETANSVVAAVKGGKSFDDAVASVDKDAKTSSLKGLSKNVIETNFSADAATWIFELDGKEYKNGAGSITTIESSSMIYIVYANNAPAKNEEIPVSVNYIKVSVGTDTTVKSEAELELAAKATANNLLASFKETAADDEAFTSLMAANESSSDGLVTAGAFENIVKGDENDEAVEAWAFDAARKNGDYEIIKGEDAYYLVYFVAADEYSVWYQTALNVLLESAYAEWDENVKAEYEDKTVTNDDVVEEVITYMTALSA